MERTNFEVLYTNEAHVEDTIMKGFYNNEGARHGFSQIYTKEGYQLACKISSGKDWYEWFTSMRGKGAVNYKLDYLRSAEDDATVIGCYVHAYDLDGNKLGYNTLNSTYVGASHSNPEAKVNEWKAQQIHEFHEMTENVGTFLTWQAWEQTRNM